MVIKSEIKEFYGHFVNAIYGFTLVLGFDNFIKLRQAGESAASVYLLLFSAFIMLLHFWIVFSTATQETFDIIHSIENRSDSLRMVWFWIEILLATLFAGLMLLAFSHLKDVTRFTGAMVFVAVWSLVWDVWAFLVNTYLRRKDSPHSRGLRRLTHELLIKWIGLDLIFTLVMTFLYLILRARHDNFNHTFVSFILLSISFFGALIDTIIINPQVYLRPRK